MNAVLDIQVRVAAREAAAALKQIENQVKSLQRGAASGGQAGGFLANWGDNMVKTGKNLTWTGRQLEQNFTLPLVLAGAAATKFAFDNEQAFAAVRKVYGDGSESAAQLRQETGLLRTSFELLSNRFGTSQKEVIDIGAAWAEAGKSGRGLQDSVELSLKAMVLGGLSAQEATQGLITVQAAYGYSTKQMIGVLERLNNVENQVPITLKGLIEGTARAGGVAKTAGIDINHLVGYLSALVPATGSAAQAGNGIRTIITRIMAPAKQAADAFKEMGINIDTVGWQSLNGVERIKRLAKSFSGLSDSQKNLVSSTIGTRWQVNRFDVLMEQVANDTGFYKKGLDAATQTTVAHANASKELAIFLGTDAKHFKILATIIQNDLAKAIAPIIPHLIQMLNVIVGLVEWFTKLSPSVQNFALMALVLLAAVGPLIRYYGAWKTLLGELAKGLSFAAQLLFGKVVATDLDTAATGANNAVNERQGGLLKVLPKLWAGASGAVVMYVKKLAVVGDAIWGWFAKHILGVDSVAAAENAAAAESAAAWTTSSAEIAAAAAGAEEAIAGSGLVAAQASVAASFDVGAAWTTVSAEMAVAQQQAALAIAVAAAEAATAATAGSLDVGAAWTATGAAITAAAELAAAAWTTAGPDMAASMNIAAVDVEAAWIAAGAAMGIELPAVAVEIGSAWEALALVLNAAATQVEVGWAIAGAGAASAMDISAVDVAAAWTAAGVEIAAAQTAAAAEVAAAWAGTAGAMELEAGAAAAATATEATGILGAIGGVVGGFLAGIGEAVTIAAAMVVDGMTLFAESIAAGAAVLGLPIEAVVLIVAAVLVAIGLLLQRFYQGGIVQFIKDIGLAFGQLPGIVAGAFGALIRVIVAAIRIVIHWLSYLNPFARHSPSLVDNVTAGVNAILGQYARLNRIPGLLAGAQSALNSFNQAAAPGLTQARDIKRNDDRKAVAEFSPGALPQLEEMYRAMDVLDGSLTDISNEIAHQQDVVDQWTASLAAANAVLDIEQGKLEALRRAASALSDAYGDAQATFENLKNTQIEGSAAMSDAIFANEQAQKKLNLQMMQLEDANPGLKDSVDLLAKMAGELELLHGQAEQLRQAGAGSDALGPLNDQIKAIEQARNAIENGSGNSPTSQYAEMARQLDELKRKGEELSLQESVQFDPLNRQLQDAAKTIHEMPFDELLAKTKAQKVEVDRLRVAYENATDEVRKQQLAVDAATAARDAVSTQFDIEKGKLQDLKDAYRAVTDQIALMNQAIQEFTSAAAAAAAAAAKAKSGGPTDFQKQFGAGAGANFAPGEGVGGGFGKEGTPFDMEQFNKDQEAQIKKLTANLGKFDIFGPIKKAFSDTWTWVKDHAAAYITGALIGVGAIIAGISVGWAAAIGLGIAEAVIHFGGIKTAAGKLYDGIKHFFGGSKDEVVKFQDIASKAQITIEKDFNKAALAINTAFVNGGGFTQKETTNIINLVNAMGDDVVKVTKSMADKRISLITDLAAKTQTVTEGMRDRSIKNIVEDRDGSLKAIEERRAGVLAKIEELRAAGITVTEDMVRTMLGSLAELRDKSIEVTSQSTSQQKALLDSLSAETGRLSKEDVKRLTDDANEKRDKVVEAARNQALDVIAEARRALEAGDISSADFQRVVVEANTMRDQTIITANDMATQTIAAARRMATGINDAILPLQDKTVRIHVVIDTQGAFPEVDKYGTYGYTPIKNKGANGGIFSLTGLASGGMIGMASGGTNAGFITKGPQVLVGEGRSQYPEYVIPTDPAYRDRAMMLFKSLANALGMPGNEAGGRLGGGLDRLITSLAHLGVGNLNMAGFNGKVAQSSIMITTPNGATVSAAVGQNGAVVNITNPPSEGGAGRTIVINGNLEFPNIKTGDDAERFIRNLESLAN